ncbi:hypothetical protein [Streptomyces sp. XY533]|uniref:hypothetical protein n=1 Tax=Streptomyces sp. XY533 TaxID=1519481 RepID=UPI000AFE2D05|nr:hypothetical protein [Streptomyces sp. XY533]
MNEYKAMTTADLRRFIAVMQVALNHGEDTGDQALTATAQRDIDDAKRELSSRA